MTRKEEVAQAYKAYMDNGGMLQSNLWFAFKAGAEWADTHPVIWHDASEEPQYKNKRILVYSEYFNAFFLELPNLLMIKYGGLNKDWGTAVLRNKISKYLYADDLLPKGGEK